MINIFQILPLIVIFLFIVAYRGIIRKRHYVYLAVAAVAYYLLYYIGRNAIEKDELWRASIFIGTIFVTIGWIVTNEISLINSRKQHTINLITDYMINTQRIYDKRMIRRYLPAYTTKLTAGIVSFDDEAHELCEAVDRELNFFEFIAIGLETGDLDLDISTRSIKTLMCSFCRQTEDYINHWQDKEPTTWEHMVALWKKWGDNPAD